MDEETHKSFKCMLVWKILTVTPSLWGRSMKANYLHTSDLFSCIHGQTDSSLSKSILNTRGLVKEGILWGIGKQDHIST